MRPDRVTRTTRIEGLVTPAFIHNGDYFLINLPVFSDGLVDSWGLLDLTLFKQKLDSGWVSVGAPEGATISVFQGGRWTVAEPVWELTPAQLYERVLELLRLMNPRMENLHDCHGRTVEERDHVRFSILGMASPVPARQSEPGLLGNRIDGDNISAVVARGSGGLEYELADLRVFADGVVQVGRVSSPEVLSLDGLRHAVGEGRIFAEPPKGARVHIHGLGSFVVAEPVSAPNPAEKLREVFDCVEKLNNRPTTAQQCWRAYDAYQKQPSEKLRKALRVAYEAVPAHNRVFLGDMDTKDLPIRMIIYGDQELEGWSHRRASRALGLPLPGIKVPKPRVRRRKKATKKPRRR